LLKEIIKKGVKRVTTPMIRSQVKAMIGMGAMSETDIVFQTIKNNEQTQKIMVDVGAHHGSSLEPFARKSWTVYAFEPDPENRKYLQRLCERFPKVIIDGRAVSNKSEKNQDFYRSDVSSGISSLHAFHPSHEKAFQVETISLRDLCRHKGISSIDFLKIDTEGHDIFVLEGVPWESISPEIILCEFEDNKTLKLGYNFFDMAEFLLEKGYTLLISEWYPITEYGSKHRWRRFSPYPCELIDKDAWGNIIAVKNKNTYAHLSSVAGTFAKRFS